MAIATCNISFEVHYTSSVPITGAVASYKIKDSADPYTVFNITPVPSNVGLVILPAIIKSGEYELVVELTASGVVTRKVSSFKIGNCGTSVCETPAIKNVEVRENGQIVMDYMVDDTNLDTPEYQIATDPDFNDVIHFRVDFDYTPLENVYMDGGNIPENTSLYIRARKHCLSPAGISDWSNVFQFESKRWVVKKAPYTFADAFCVSAKFKDPTNSNESGASICWSEGVLKKTISLTTPFPQEGSYIYLSDGITPAIPANLGSFDTGVASSGFKDRGIRWVRFGSYNGSKIYNVDPSSGLITSISTSYNCAT